MSEKSWKRKLLSKASYNIVMDDIGVKSGKPKFIEEILEDNKHGDVDGNSVCVIGRLNEHEVDICQAKLSDPQSKKDLYVNTSLIEPFGARFGSLFQMIGELETSIIKGDNDVVLKARVVRCVDGMDMTLYRKAVDCQRMYLQKRGDLSDQRQ